jgi:hypothetical protein
MKLRETLHTLLRYRPRQRIALPIAWLCVLCLLSLYAIQLAKVGTDLRWDFWDYWQNNRFYSDPNSALFNGRHVLVVAKKLERDDYTSLPPDPNRPTIANPGPGLFDSPLDFHTLHDRWKNLRPVYAHLLRGWVATYDELVRDEPGGDYVMDYPPLRSLAMTLWTWKVTSQFPTITEFPEKNVPLLDRTGKPTWASPDIVHPLLVCNLIAEATSAIAMFFLVFIWCRRSDDKHTSLIAGGGSPGLGAPEIEDRGFRPRLLKTSHWGDPLLILPAFAYGIALLLRPHFVFDSNLIGPNPSIIDARIASPGWWLFVILRYTAAISLARLLPGNFRAIACATVAATIAWINPASILDSFGWPQWESWLIPFFLIAAVLVSVDWWLTAGIVLGVGGMFKGQLFFIAPVLILCPLFAGWFGKFTRILTGVALGAALVVWPWLFTNSKAEAYVVGVAFAAIIVGAMSFLRGHLRFHLGRHAADVARRIRKQESLEPAKHTVSKWLLSTAFLAVLAIAAVLPMLGYRQQDWSTKLAMIGLTLLILLPTWFLRPRSLGFWLALVITASVWLAALSLNGSFSWWEVGFLYGTQKHQTMQLGDASLSNLSSLLDQRYHWSLHDLVGSLHVPWSSTPIDLDIQSTSALLYAVGLLLASIAAGFHLRRNDRSFLIAITAPSMLMVALLTQMAARYTIFPAVIAVCLVGVGVGPSMLSLLCLIVSCIMLSNQLLRFDPSTAPVMYSLTRSTFPDMGWMMLLLAGIFLVAAMTPRGARLRAPACDLNANVER